MLSLSLSSRLAVSLTSLALSSSRRLLLPFCWPCPTVANSLTARHRRSPDIIAPRTALEEYESPLGASFLVMPFVLVAPPPPPTTPVFVAATFFLALGPNAAQHTT